MKTFALLLILAGHASAATITLWDFSNLSLDPVVGTGTLSPLGNVKYAFVSGLGYSLYALNTSQYPAQSLGNKSAGIECQVSTAGYVNIEAVWIQRVSPAASKYSRLQISTNGTDFMDTALVISLFLADDFEYQGISFNVQSGAYNNPNFAFRIVTEFESTATGATNQDYYTTVSGQNYSTLGTVRFGTLFIYGDRLAPTLGPISQSTNGIQFRVAGAPGSNYVVQATSEAGSPDWQSLATNASPFTFVEADTSKPQRLYRALLLP